MFKDDEAPSVVLVNVSYLSAAGMQRKCHWAMEVFTKVMELVLSTVKVLADKNQPFSARIHRIKLGQYYLSISFKSYKWKEKKKTLWILHLMIFNLALTDTINLYFYYIYHSCSLWLLYHLIAQKKKQSLRRIDSLNIPLILIFPQVQTLWQCVFRSCEKETWQCRRIHF